MPAELPPPPVALLLCVGFFAVSGALELVLPLLDGGGARVVWTATGQSLLHWLLAAGLWRRLLLCRVLALVYCIAALITYGVVLGLALAQAPLEFPLPVVVMSLFQVPSCAVLMPWLRSPEAHRILSRRLWR